MGSTVEELSTEDGDLDEAVVRERFNAIVVEDGRPLARIAPETGIHYTTLSAWKAGNYSGNNERITGQVNQWLTTREAKKRTHAVLPEPPAFIMTPTASAIIDVLEAAQVLPDMAVISGAAGIGKTTAIEWYQRRAANVWLVTMEPSHTTLGSVMGAICQAVGYLKSRSASDMSENIRRRMTGTGGLLILDEAQNLTLEAVDQIRAFHDRAKVGIAMVGNETVAGRYSAASLTAEYAPLFRRIGQKFRQRALKKGDLDLLVGAWNLSDEGAQAVARAVGRAPGAAGIMTKVLRLAFLLAHHDQRPQPNKKDMETAWEQLSARTEGGAA